MPRLFFIFDIPNLLFHVFNLLCFYYFGLFFCFKFIVQFYFVDVFLGHLFIFCCLFFFNLAYDWFGTLAASLNHGQRQHRPCEEASSRNGTAYTAMRTWAGCGEGNPCAAGIVCSMQTAGVVGHLRSFSLAPTCGPLQLSTGEKGRLKTHVRFPMNSDKQIPMKTGEYLYTCIYKIAEKLRKLADINSPPARTHFSRCRFLCAASDKKTMSYLATFKNKCKAKRNREKSETLSDLVALGKVQNLSAEYAKRGIPFKPDLRVHTCTAVPPLLPS